MGAPSRWMREPLVVKGVKPRNVDVSAGTDFGIMMRSRVVIGKAARAAVPSAPVRPRRAGAGPQTITLLITAGAMQPFTTASGVLMVPLRPTLQKLQLPFVFKSRVKTMVANTAIGTIKHRANTSVVYVDGKIHALSAPSRIINDRLFVPADLVTVLTGMNVTWDPSTRVLTIQ